MAIFVIVVMVFGAVPAFSQAGFMAGLATGALLFGDGDHPGTAATVIYTLPKVSERVKNSLEIKMVAIYGYFAPTPMEKHLGELSLQQIFDQAVKKSDKFVILQVARFIKGDYPVGAAIWFAYIEKENVLPLK